jgi:hypothetical protein
LCAAAVAAGTALVLNTAGGIYGDYSGDILMMTVLLAIVPAALIQVLERAGGTRLTSEARAAIALSFVALLVKLAALLHPAKPVIDAVFHAHRLDWVIGGKYLFTQPFVGGVEMPYAIGLYVFAWPWTWIVTDHVALIRTVAAATDVAAGLLLYPLVGRFWGDRRAAAFAVLFFQLAPLPYAVLGNANLTNMFGQSLALVVVAAAVLWNLDIRRPLLLSAFAGLVASAFLSHVSTITMLIATLGALAVFYWWRGDEARRRTAAAIVVASVVALVVSWLVYYQHFSEEMSGALTRMFSGGASTSPATAEEAARGYMGVAGRAWDLVVQARGSAGWPIVILAIVGTWSLLRQRKRDRLTSALMAWGAMWLVFSIMTVFSRVDREYVRYATEFLGRINLAALPVVAILAGRGAAAGWAADTPAPARTPLRALTVALTGWAVVIATRALLGWFDR